uniref:Uncharacterized protein n=1 Tax=Anguilla anguilla TaxID=7936 RepID=A0A0E9W8S7_ANGAN
MELFKTPLCLDGLAKVTAKYLIYSPAVLALTHYVLTWISCNSLPEKKSHTYI